MPLIDDRLALILAAGGLLMALPGVRAQIPRNITLWVKAKEAVTAEQLCGPANSGDGVGLMVRTFRGDTRQLRPFCKFVVDGKQLEGNLLAAETRLAATIATSVRDAGKQRNIFAQKNVDGPQTEIAFDTGIIGKIPAKSVAAQVLSSDPPLPVPERLPTSTGHLPLIPLVSLYLIGGSLCLRKLNRS